MPVLNNEKHEKFCRLMADGATNADAYYGAGYRSGTRSIATAKASGLRGRPEIAARINELRAIPHRKVNARKHREPGDVEPTIPSPNVVTIGAQQICENGRTGEQIYRPEIAALARRVALLGATSEELAGVLGVATKTVNTWLAERPEFREAVRAGKIEADANVAESLYRRAIGDVTVPRSKIFLRADDAAPVYAPYDEHYPPDVAAAQTWLRSRRHNWRERTEVTVPWSERYERMNEDERMAAVNELMSAVRARLSEAPTTDAVYEVVDDGSSGDDEEEGGSDGGIGGEAEGGDDDAG